MHFSGLHSLYPLFLGPICMFSTIFNFQLLHWCFCPYFFEFFFFSCSWSGFLGFAHNSMYLKMGKVKCSFLDSVCWPQVTIVTDWDFLFWGISELKVGTYLDGSCKMEYNKLIYRYVRSLKLYGEEETCRLFLFSNLLTLWTFDSGLFWLLMEFIDLFPIDCE